MAWHPTRMAAALVAGAALALPAAAQESEASVRIDAYKLKAGLPGAALPVDCGSGGCSLSDPDFVELQGRLDGGLSVLRAEGEAYFENPLVPGSGVLQMKGWVRQQAHAGEAAVFTTVAELRQTVSWTWEARDEVGAWFHTYRFDGEVFQSLAGGATGSVSAEALGTGFYNGSPGPLAPCLPTAVAGECQMPFIPGELDGAPVEQTLVLRLTATLTTDGNPGPDSLQWADYRHTLALLSAVPYGADGKPLAGPWALYADGVLAFSAAPVPEPAAAWLALAGLAVLRRRLGSRRGRG